MRTASLVLICLIGLGLAACGGDDSPQDQCKDLVNATCGRIAECVAELAGQSASTLKNACVKAAGAECDDVEGEPAFDVDECIDDIESISCDDLVPNAEDGDFEPAAPDSCG